MAALLSPPGAHLTTEAAESPSGLFSPLHGGDLLTQRREDPDLPFPPGLDSPPAIQEFLDGLAYSAEPVYRCPASVLRDSKGHCFDGGVLAAAALRRIGF